MKIFKSVFLFIFSGLFLVSSAVLASSEYSVDGIKIVDQDRQQIAYENMVSQLRKLHGDIYALPYDGEYIRTTIIPEVNSQRAVLAPHYPERNSYGDSADMAYQQLRNWFDTYPAECSAYIDYLIAYIANHSN